MSFRYFSCFKINYLFFENMLFPVTIHYVNLYGYYLNFAAFSLYQSLQPEQHDFLLHRELLEIGKQ